MKKEFRLLDLLADRYALNRLVLCSSQEEAELLRAWLSSPAEKKAPAAASALHQIPAEAGIRPVCEAADLSSLKEQISACSRCGQISARKQAFGSGISGLMIVFHTPFLVSRMEMEQYKKESMVMLQKMTAAIDLSLKDCYTTNLIKCDPESPLMQPSTMTENCLDILEKEISFVKPGFVLVMGDIRPMGRIVNSDSGIKWFAVDHPVAMIKNPDLKRKAWVTLTNLKAEMAGRK